MSLEYGGKSVYGAVLGILMLEARFPRIRGDIGNATKLLRERGMAVAAKKASRAANQGLIASATADGGRHGCDLPGPVPPTGLRPHRPDLGRRLHALPQ